MNKKFLVTGGTGFIGSAIVKSLIKTGYFVKVLDNQSRGSNRRLKEVEGRFEMIKGDIRNMNTVQRACKGIDSVIHLAYINGTEFFYTKPELVLEVGVKGMMNVLDACISNNIEEILLASSSEVYQTPAVIPTSETVPLTVPDPLNSRYSYGGGKIISELLTINYGRKYFRKAIIFRPHNVYGSDMGWEHVIPQLTLRVRKLVKDSKVINLPIQGTGKETRAFIYIDDFVTGFNKILQKGKHLEIYNIGVMEETSIQELILEIGKIYGIKIKIVPGKLTPGSTQRRCPDISKLKKLGFKPKFDLVMGLQETIQWYNDFAHLQFKND
ncbi:SDR family NAD(P)-dependent oxidoreductase [Candidatus Daviesbacteria bacterium]|nr:SDR family NAD(P)-dependent oxidoreductase [Candidatus Daviesbacteria bacterium]